MLDDILDKYNTTVHKTIKMKPIEVTGDSYPEYNKIANKKILNLKLVIMLEFENIQTFLHFFQIDQNRLLLLIRLKIQCLGLMLLVIWMVKKLLEVFMKKNCKKLIKNNLE